MPKYLCDCFSKIFLLLFWWVILLTSYWYPLSPLVSISMVPGLSIIHTSVDSLTGDSLSYPILVHLYLVLSRRYAWVNFIWVKFMTGGFITHPERVCFDFPVWSSLFSLYSCNQWCVYSFLTLQGGLYIWSSYNGGRHWYTVDSIWVSLHSLLCLLQYPLLFALTTGNSLLCMIYGSWNIVLGIGCLLIIIPLLFLHLLLHQ